MINFSKNPEAFKLWIYTWFGLNLNCPTTPSSDDKLSGWRKLPWRETNDIYAIVISEFMLQQTQVMRVREYYPRWIIQFPDWAALASASRAEVLCAWQGLGYNHRALRLQDCARILIETYQGKVPQDYDTLCALPGIGPATAAAIQIFGFNKPSLYIETNVRAVYLHHFFPNAITRIDDKKIIPFIEATQDTKHPRLWNWLILDYGAWIKKHFPNPTRTSTQYRRQSSFKNSRRYYRGQILKRVLQNPLSIQSIVDIFPEININEVIRDLQKEGFIVVKGTTIYPSK